MTDGLLVKVDLDVDEQVFWPCQVRDSFTKSDIHA